MGKVYRAFDTKLRRPVALKILALGGSDWDVDVVAIALREARAASAIAHPNVTSVFDADWVDGTAYIVMEYVPGVQLRRLIGDASIPLATRLRWLVEVAGALAAAHALGVIHRDVKPENVIVRDDGMAKVLDFGIARVPRGDAGQDDGAPVAGFSTWTQGGHFVGTPGYMAPEVLRGRDVDGRADQFAWGVLAYELCAGRPPWKRADSGFGSISSVLNDEPEPLGPDIPPEVALVVMRALAKAPEDRFASLGEVIALLAPLSGRMPMSLPPPPESVTRVAPPALAPSSFPRARSSHPPPRSTLQAISGTVHRDDVALANALTREEPPQIPAPAAPTMTSGIEGALRRPAFDAPVDLEAHVALLPASATCKGLFFLDKLRFSAGAVSPDALAERAGIPKRRYLSFHDYPMEENLRLLHAAAGATFPEVPVGEGLRRLGHLALDVVLETHIGRTLFGIFGRDLEPLLRQGSRAYRIFFNFGAVTTSEIDRATFVFRAQGFPVFLETYQVGVIEGLFRHCGRAGDVSVAMDGLACATIRVCLH